MYEDIRNNKIKTGVIVSLFILLVTLISYYVCIALDFGVYSIIIAIIFSIITSWSSYYFSDKIILSLNKARPANDEQEKKLSNILDSLIISAGLEQKPRLYVIEDIQANAFATGRNPKNSIICVTTGLIDMMDYYELEGVLAHELAHIKNYDILLSTIVTIMVGFVVMISDIFTRSIFYSRNNKDNDNKNGMLMIIGLFFLILSPIFANIMKFAISRRREYLADSTAIQFTRNPSGLISALNKLKGDSNQLQNANNATAHMFIVNPFKEKSTERKKSLSDLFSTHPPIDDRIKALEELK